MRTAIRNRYTLIRYYYSAFWDINEFGGSFFKPLFFEFGDDAEAYKIIEKNMLLGNGLKASVEVSTLDELESVPFYFPEGVWCQILPVVNTTFTKGCINATVGKNVTFRSHMEDYYVHMRNGYIIPLQNATEYKTNNTKDQYNQPHDLFIIPNKTNMAGKSGYISGQAAAMGYIYFDDGISYVKNISRHDFWFAYNETNADTVASLNFSESVGDYKNMTAAEQIGNITIFNPFHDADGSTRQFTKITGNYMNNGALTAVDLSTQAGYYDDNSAASLILTINMMMPATANADEKRFRFDEMHSVVIEYPAPAA